MPRLMTGLIAAAVLSSPLFAAGEDKEILPARDAAELEQRLAGILKEHKVPGLCVVIANRDRILWTAGIGQADVATARAVTPDTLFRAASISKLFAGLAALKLVEEGRLDLQAPVRSLVPEVQFTNPWEATSPVRVVHLLEHTTGWEHWHPVEWAHNDPRPASLAEGLAVCPASRTSRWRPGTRHSYSNSSPAVVAAVVEKLTGRRFEDYVAETFFEPIGMPTADYFLSPRSRSLLTTLYRPDGTTPYPYWHPVMRPAAALNASAREMGALLRFFLGRGEIDGRRLLSEASIRRMETPTTHWGAQGGLTTGYGLDNDTTLDDRGFVWHGHAGGLGGCTSNVLYLPDHGVGYFFSINNDSLGAFGRANEELQAYVTRDLPRPALPPVRPLSEGLAAPFAGWYVPLTGMHAFTACSDRILGLTRVTFSADRMHLRSSSGSFDLLPVEGGPRFRKEKEVVATRVLLDTPDDGRVLASEYGPLGRIPTAQAWLTIVGTALFLLALISVPLFALVWVPRWTMGRLRGVPNLRVRVLPLLAALALFALVALGAAVQNETIERLGRPTPWSVGITASTWAFAALSVASLWVAVRARREGMNRWAYLHSLFAAVMFVVATAYLAWFGVIGYRSWV